MQTGFLVLLSLKLKAFYIFRMIELDYVFKRSRYCILQTLIGCPAFKDAMFEFLFLPEPLIIYNFIGDFHGALKIIVCRSNNDF